MDFSDTQTYVISDLGGFKKFLNQGLRLSIEEEKVPKGLKYINVKCVFHSALCGV